MASFCTEENQKTFVLKMTEIYEKLSLLGTGGQRRLAGRLCLREQIRDSK
jgi:hypothetical protein